MITEQIISVITAAYNLYTRGGNYPPPTLDGFLSFLIERKGQYLMYEGTIPATAPEKEKQQ